MAGERRGRTRELRVADHHRDRGYICYRLAWGQADVIALHHNKPPLLIQVKSTAGGPYERFGPGARLQLLAEAVDAGADCILAWWPKGGQLQLIGPEDWPQPRVTA